MRTLNNLNKTEGGQATFFGSVQGVACTHSVHTDQKVVELEVSADYLHSLFFDTRTRVSNPRFLVTFTQLLTSLLLLPIQMCPVPLRQTEKQCLFRLHVA